MSKKNAEMRTNGIGGRLVRHLAMECDKRKSWETSGPVTQEKGWKQRRVKESIETFREELKGKQILNQCDYLDSGWKAVLQEIHRIERRN